MDCPKCSTRMKVRRALFLRAYDKTDYICPVCGHNHTEKANK